MPNVSSFGAQTDNAVVSGTVADRQMIIPEVPPQGLMSVGPRVTPNFVKPREWNAQTTYHFFDAVRDVAGNAYVATKPVVAAGTPLTDEDYWFLWADPDTRFDDLNETVKTFNQRITQNTNDIATKAPINHASEETIYGIGNGVDYGHVKLAADDTLVSNDANNGIAATPKYVADAIYYVTPEMFGAKGDGATDDTDAIQEAINTHKPVFFGRKKYVTRELTLFTGALLFGTGWETIIEYSGTQSLFDNSNLADVKIYNMRFVATNNGIFVTLTYTSGIDSNTWSHIYAGLRIENFKICLNIPYHISYASNNYCCEIHFYSCKIFNCATTLYCDNLQAFNNSFVNCEIERNFDDSRQGTPFFKTSSGEFTFVNCSIIGDTFYELQKSMENFALKPTLNFTDCRFEINNSNETLFKLNQSGAGYSTVFFNLNNCLFEWSRSATTTNMFEICTRGNISANNISLTTAGGIELLKITPKAGVTGIINDIYTSVRMNNVNGNYNVTNTIALYAPLVEITNSSVNAYMYPYGCVIYKEDSIVYLPQGENAALQKIKINVSKYAGRKLIELQLIKTNNTSGNLKLYKGESDAGEQLCTLDYSTKMGLLRTNVFSKITINDNLYIDIPNGNTGIVKLMFA